MQENARYGTNLKPGASFADAIALVHVAKAVTGDLSAIKEITDRVEGRATKRDEFVAQPDATINVVWDSSPSTQAARLAEPSSSVRVAHE